MPLPAPLLLQTTHKEKAIHGFGTKSIARIVEKYGGNLTFSNENKTFTLTAVFFLGKSKAALLTEELNENIG
jgi:sensor histidine kinase regulating citrate/malate metabolism